MDDSGLHVLLDQHEKELQEHNKRLESLERWRTDTSVFSATFNEQLKSIKESLDLLMKKVNEIEKQPVDRWNTLIKAIITGIVGFLVGYLLNRG